MRHRHHRLADGVHVPAPRTVSRRAARNMLRCPSLLLFDLTWGCGIVFGLPIAAFALAEKELFYPV